MKPPIIAVAVSGGVDSLVSAFLLKQTDARVFGLHFTTGYDTRQKDMMLLKDQLKMDIITLDLSIPFEQEVVKYFVSAYTRGKTPNPCMVCNQKIKFGVLLDQAKKLGADFLATGHYATIVNSLTRPDHDADHAWLEKGTDAEKDQSYFLGRLSSRQLSRIICPLAGVTKDRVRALAAQNGLVPVTSKESQDICFVHDNHIVDFITQKTGLGPRPGPVMDINGRQVGTHNGVQAFTIGQRRGINCPASEPYYVKKIDPSTNTLYVCFKPDLAQTGMEVEQVMWNDTCADDIQDVATRIRYRHKEAPSRLIRNQTPGRVVFQEPQYAVTPGQAAVFYRGRRVLGSGIIQ
jgi:tRNA-uridine 2-sulfurtransferase